MSTKENTSFVEDNQEEITTTETKLHPCLSYGVAHSKQLVKSVVSPFLSEVDEDGNLIKRHSDLYLLLRQKNLQKQIGTDVLRQYFENQKMAGNTSLTTDTLTDDQLFDLIEPKAVNNLTTAYEWSKYLQKNSDTIKANYERYKIDSKKRFDISNYFKSKRESTSNSDESTLNTD